MFPTGRPPLANPLPCPFEDFLGQVCDGDHPSSLLSPGGIRCPLSFSGKKGCQGGTEGPFWIPTYIPSWDGVRGSVSAQIRRKADASTPFPPYSNGFDWSIRNPSFLLFLLCFQLSLFISKITNRVPSEEFLDEPVFFSSFFFLAHRWFIFNACLQCRFAPTFPPFKRCFSILFEFPNNLSVCVHVL